MMNDSIEKKKQVIETEHNTRDYCVAIRTLGTAGEKYQKLLDSLVAQTLPPKKILVYIPYGYSVPKETVGIEQIVQCEKGMVAQRSLPFNEVDTEYILFCDDDVLLPPTLIEELFDAMNGIAPDCLSPQVVNEGVNMVQKIYAFMHNFTLPHLSKKWDVKINKSGSYSYNIRGKKVLMPTQSACFACFLCKKSSYNWIHYEDERWLDGFKYASCDDQLFFYKMFLHGFSGYKYYGQGIVHLDAQAGGRHNVSEKFYNQKKIAFIIWYRTIFHLCNNSIIDKVLAVFMYFCKVFIGLLFLPVEVLYHKNWKLFIDFIKAQVDGYKYVHSEEYLSIPPYDYYKR